MRMDFTSETLFIVLTIIAVLQSCGVCITSNPGSDVEELQGLLKNAREINRKLQWQNKRLMMMWSGLAQMCRALQFNEEEPTTANQDNGAVTFEQQIPDIKYIDQEIPDKKAPTSSGNKSDMSNTEKEATPIPPLYINSIKSKGIGYLNITINYTAPEDHTTDWFAHLYRYGELRSAGNRRAYPDSTFTVYELYFDPQSLQKLYFQLHTQDKTAILELNITELGTPGEQVLPEFEGDVTFSQQTYHASKQDTVEIFATLPVSMIADITLDDTFVYFSGLNASGYSTEMFQYSNKDSEFISLAGAASTVGNVSAENLIIMLKPDYASYGGIVTINLPGLGKIKPYVLKLTYERHVTVTSAETGDVIPRNTVWLANIDTQTTISSEFASLWCTAMGNPAPEVQLLRQLQSGKTKRKRTQSVYSSPYMTVETHTLSRSDKRRGLYICRATSGNQTVEETTEVQFVRLALFDETVTGMVRETPEELDIKCKVTGEPVPQLEIWDETINGKSMLSVNASMDTEVENGKEWRVMTATVSKIPDFALFCVAKQEGVKKPYFYQIY